MIKFIATTILIFFILPVQAETALEIHGLSKHYGTSQKFNEKNIGIGLTFNKLSIGTYKNSLYKQSNYIAYELPKVFYKNIHFGLDVGLVTGYNGSVAPLVLPAVTIDTFGKTFLKFRVLPAIGDITPAVASVSAGIKF